MRFINGDYLEALYQKAPEREIPKPKGRLRYA